MPNGHNNQRVGKSNEDIVKFISDTRQEGVMARSVVNK